MTPLITGLEKVLDHLDKLYYETEKEEDREKLKTYFDNLSKLLEEAVRTRFDENDKLYKDTIKKLKETEKQIARLKTDLAKITGLFKTLSELMMQIDTLVF